MIKMLNACTAEIDDVDAAVNSIQGQLNLSRELLSNSVGIIACHYEFINTGMVEELCKRLPFPVVGCTTLGNAAKDECGVELLSISVLTSDDVVFSTAMSGELDPADILPAVSAVYKQALEGLGGEPALILAYAPLMLSLGASPIIKAINSLGGGIPVFGAISCDSSPDYHASKVIHNGTAAAKTLALVLLKGNVKPQFYVNTIPEADIRQLAAVVTDSDGCLIKKVNDMPFLDYLESVGVSKEGVRASSGAFPIIADYNDGSKPTGLAIYSTTPEGYALLGGEIPVGSTIAMANMDYKGVLETAVEAVKKAIAPGNVSGLLMYPCLTRNLALGANTDDEMKAIVKTLEGKYPYQFCYAGGEICPVYTGDGKLMNRAHNLTYIICVFYE
ncbi:MAG: FIST C-terminal domain-containing protein [Treponema sp.]|jgi:hypothetical protein|nr:FIST C-terminal domain-containing protein [Treponema sp.]